MSTSIAEGNRSIAFFMDAIDETGYFQASTIGKTKVPTGRLWMQERFPNNMHLCIESELQYHSSWDWIIPVCIKIRKTYTEVATSDKLKWRKLHGLIGAAILDFDIIKTHESIIQFITWYNSLTPKQQ